MRGTEATELRFLRAATCYKMAEHKRSEGTGYLK